MADKKRAQRVSHVENKNYPNASERFASALNGRLGDKRLINRILNGRKVKPCGRECREYGLMIAEQLNHGSFVNFTELMNDEEFILEIARITPNPTECENYFYQYINPYIMKKTDFRLKFLKEVYLNENVYKLDDINLIVEWCGLVEENQIILADKEFKKVFEKRLEKLNNFEMPEYHCSGEDEKELHDYKVLANDKKILFENTKKGLAQILGSFVKTEDEKEIEDKDDFWSYMCAKAFNL